MGSLVTGPISFVDLAKFHLPDGLSCALGIAFAERIRTKLLKDGHIDTVIGLPANLFYSTGIPVCILVLKKCKKPDDVLFINAAEHFTKGKRQNQLGDGKNGTPDHIGKIVSTYQFRKEEERYSKRISMERIAEEGYNLNISRYISTAVAEEEIKLDATHNDLLEIETEIECGVASILELGWDATRVIDNSEHNTDLSKVFGEPR